VIGAVRVTGDYDYELRVACAHAAEIETVIDVRKREHGVRELRSPRDCREIGTRLVPSDSRRFRPVKHESRLARGGFRIAGAGFEPATFGL
jgi:hypothetical protein